jgi:hypothetical protein
MDDSPSFLSCSHMLVWAIAQERPLMLKSESWAPLTLHGDGRGAVCATVFSSGACNSERVSSS